MRCSLLLLGAVGLLAGPAAGILNPVLPQGADQYFDAICTASAQYKLRDPKLVGCAAVHAAHCEKWLPNPRPAAERTACKAVFANLLEAFKSDIRGNKQKSGMNPFQALLVLGGWHAAKDDWLKNPSSTLSPFHTVWDVPVPMMDAACGKQKPDEVFAGVDAAVRIEIIKKAMMGFMGDDRTATMWKLLTDCAAPVTKAIQEQNKAGRLPLKLTDESVLSPFKMGAIGSIDPSSDFDISVNSAVMYSAAAPVEEGSQAAKWRHSQTTAVVACVNTAFLPVIGDVVNAELRRLSGTGSDATAKAAAAERWGWKSFLTSASFYDSNCYSEDEIPSEVSVRNKQVQDAAADPGFVIASNYLTDMQAELRRDTRGVGDAWLSAATARSSAVGRLAVSQTLDQLVWALLDENTLHHVPNADQVVPQATNMVDGARGTPDLEYWPYGVAFKEGAGGASQQDSSGLDFDPQAPHGLPRDASLPLHLLSRKAAFGHLLNHLRSCTTECLKASTALEAAVIDSVFNAVDATSKGHLPSDAVAKWKTTKDSDHSAAARGPLMLANELKIMARNIIYVETGKMADEARTVKDYVAKHHADDTAALGAAVRAYYNLRSLSLEFAAEAGRTSGVLWHVLPVLQMGHPLLDLGLPMLLPAFVENAANLQHQAEKIAEPNNPRTAGGTRATADTPCSATRKTLLTTMLDKGGKYLFRSIDALRRMDGGWRDNYPGTYGATNYQRCDGDPTPAEVVAARNKAGQTPRLLALDTNLADSSVAGKLRGVASGSSSRQQVLSAAQPMDADSLSLSLIEVSAGANAAASSVWSKASIIPTTESEFAALLCGPTGVVSFNAPVPSDPQSECAKAVLPRYYELMDKSRITTAAGQLLGEPQQQTVSKRVARAAQLMGGLGQAYALLSGRTDENGPNGWEGARKKDNKNVVREAFSADLALALKEPLPIYDQLLGSVRLALAGGLSRMLGEGRCFARYGRIDDACMPSIIAGCKFSVPVLPAAGNAPATQRAAAEAALTALDGAFSAKSQQEAAALQKQHQAPAAPADGKTTPEFDWATESAKLYDLSPRAFQTSAKLFDWSELTKHILTSVQKHLARPAASGAAAAAPKKA